jgi:hypothetical protein
MACILRIFGVKTKPAHKPPESERYSVRISLEDPLPTSSAELHILEECLSARMSHVNKKRNLALSNAVYAKQRNDMRKYLAHMVEYKRYAEELQEIEKRLEEIVITESNLRYGVPPPLSLPPPAMKFEGSVIQNPSYKERNVTNGSPTQLVHSRPLGRAHSHLTYVLPTAPPHLRGRTQRS